MTVLSPPSLQPIIRAGFAWLFLDYDGTLADFAPNPDVLQPNAEVVDLIQALFTHPNIQVAIISGRQLHHVAELLPVTGLIIAGTYGIEQRTPKGEIYYPVKYEMIRPSLDQIKARWLSLIEKTGGFYLEDKGYALALHARLASEVDAVGILEAARAQADMLVSQSELKILGGNRFLEVAPLQADKGNTVTYLWEKYPLPGAIPIYIGDDDKDEQAFKVVNDLGGMTAVVMQNERPTNAQYRFTSPTQVRVWLRDLLDGFSSSTGNPPATTGFGGLQSG